VRIAIKSKHIRSSMAMLLASSALSLALPAMAQDAVDETAEEGGIIVTANKREQNLQDVPAAVSAIGNEQLDQLQVSELQDVVKYLPSVTIQQGGPGFAQVYFRGVASGENANHSASLPTVGTYLDEMPITTIQGALDIHAYDLARVEALAGPQGTLYGASSMAGTLKLITNQPDTSGFYGNAGVEINSVAHGDFGSIFEGFINAPLSEKAALRLVGWYRDDGGYIDNIPGSRTYATSGITQNNAALVEKNYNDAQTYGARLALGIDLNDSWTIKPTLMGQVQKTEGNYARERSGQNSGKYQTVQYNPEGSKDKWINGALTIEGKLGNWDLTLTGGHLRRKTETQSDYSDYGYFYDALAGYGAYWYDNNGDYVSANQYIQGIDRYKKSFAEFRISSPQDASLRFIGGLFWQRQSHNIEQNYIIDNIADDITVPGTDSNIWLTKQQRTDRDYAAFGEVSFDLTDKLTLTGGARLYKFDNSLFGFFGFARGYSGNTGVARCITTTGQEFRDNPGGTFATPILAGAPCTNVDKSTSDTDAIFKANATYKISDDALVYATWSRGFRPGGINRRGTLPPYGPDELDNYELGWKTNFGAFRFNGAVYQLDWNNIQLSFLGANGLTEIRNAGIARIRGAEIDVGYRSGGFSLNMGMSYNDAEIRRDFCAIANPQFDCTIDADLDGSGAIDSDNEINQTLAPNGSRLPVTAKFKANAVARYEFPISEWNGHIQLAANHTGSRRSDLRTLQSGIKGGLGSYTSVDFSFGIKNDLWSIEAFATNLFDEFGVVNTGVSCVETVCGTGVTPTTPTGGAFYDTVIKPRLIGLKFSRDF
jgi:iron complex outermembrane recepter protein